MTIYSIFTLKTLPFGQENIIAFIFHRIYISYHLGRKNVLNPYHLGRKE